MAGANTIYGSGMLELGVTFSMEQLVLDNEIIAMEKKAMEGIVINEETLAVDAIKEIGVGGDFLGHPSTMDNIDLASDPMVFDRYMIGDWKAAGSKSAVDVAHDIVNDVMNNHVVMPIPAEILEKMRKIVKKADDEFKKSRSE
jgi:trimethylamine--corrinoid protein Co-methyltransferase